MIDRSQIRILLLDDEPFILKLMGRMTVNLGFPNVTLCQSGVEALRHVDMPDLAPQLILCDLNMPEMDGVEFLRRLVEHDYAGSVILISGEDKRALQASEKLALAHGINMLGTLHKPVSPQGLEEMIARWMPAHKEVRRSRKAYGADRVREAIESGELVNHFQPQVQIANGRLTGVETLVRWHHPQDGLVFPDQFIGIAEDHGLIDALTKGVVVDALAQLGRWRASGLVQRIAINISMDNLRSLEFVDFVTEQASAAGVAPQDVVLEVTESRLMNDLRTPLEVLTRLRLKRFRLSIDDFGTGHSSLAQLRDVPFDELKIDRSFVHGATADETARAIYGASLGLAQQLKMDTVAEGVENHADWNFLRQTGCSLAQGYFIGRPMPGAEMPDWTRLWADRLEREGLTRGAEPS